MMDLDNVQLWSLFFVCIALALPFAGFFSARCKSRIAGFLVAMVLSVAMIAILIWSMQAVFCWLFPYLLEII